MQRCFHRLIGLALCSACLAGCATHVDHLHQIRSDFYRGNLVSATERIDKRLKRPRYDADVLKLERAMIQLAEGQPGQAEQALREVRDRFDHLEQNSLAEQAASALTDDNRLAYAGEDYEKVLIRAMLALANLMHDGGDAGAYALQMGEKQQAIIQAGVDDEGHNPKLAYKRVALGPYLHGLLREETHSNYDDVARAYQQVVWWEPQFAYGSADLDRAVHGRHSAPGHGVLYVFALVGRGPYKEEAAEIPTTVALLIADRILTATGKHSLPPTIAPVKVPKVVVPYNVVRCVEVGVNGGAVGDTQTITDVGQLAVSQYEAVYPQVLARAVVRRAIKKGIVYAGKEVAGLDRGSPLSLALDVGGIVWEATESADTRCWGLLPDKVQVLRVELSSGEHRIDLQASDGRGPIGPVFSQTVTITDGRNSYVLANFPDSQLVGRILTSQPAGL